MIRPVAGAGGAPGAQGAGGGAEDVDDAATGAGGGGGGGAEDVDDAATGAGGGGGGGAEDVDDAATGAGSRPTPGVRMGRVAAFDEAAGLGEVKPDSGDGPYPFHCTQIAGGSRTIEVGTKVNFTVVPGHLGRWEAAGVEPVSRAEPS